MPGENVNEPVVASVPDQAFAANVVDDTDGATGATESTVNSRYAVHAAPLAAPSNARARHLYVVPFTSAAGVHVARSPASVCDDEPLAASVPVALTLTSKSTRPASPSGSS